MNVGLLIYSRHNMQTNNYYNTAIIIVTIDSVGSNRSNEEIHRKRICLVVVVVSVVWAVICAAVVLGLVFGPNKGNQLTGK